MLKKGDKAPDFTLQDTRGDKVSLSDIIGDKQVLILFFPLAYTGTCTKELCSVRDNMKLYESLDAQILAISVDSFHVLREYKKSQNLNFTLLSDFNREVSRKYGTLYNDFYGMKGVSKRSAFVVGRDGSLLYAEVLEDADKLPDFEAITGALQDP